MNTLLLIHNIGYIADILLSFFLGIFVFSRGWNKKPNILYFCTAITYVFYCIVYLLASNQTSPDLARFYGYFMMISALTVSLNAHLAFSTFKIEAQNKWFIRAMYASLALMYVFLILDPSRFNDISRPLSFFTYFPHAGSYYWLYSLFFFIVASYFLTAIARLYTKADPVEKNRIKYFLFAFTFAYTLAITSFQNVFGYDFISPMVSMFIGLYTIPLGYAVFRYNTIDINIAARKVALYTISTALFTGLFIAMNVLNNYILLVNPSFPIWVLPFLLGILMVIAWLITWRQIRESDVLKYEFINNITHTFRTPLTHIRWLAEELRGPMTQEEKNKAAEQIQFASMRLFELTNAVIDTSAEKNNLFLYHFTSLSLGDLLTDLYKSHADQIASKKQRVSLDVDPEVPNITADHTRLQFAMQILLENALIYTPEGGSVDIKVRQIAGEVLVSFKDNGIGINADDLPHLFSKFYRSQNARHTDTEGMGIGLYMAKNTVEKHKGRIWVESRGENLGSMFSVALPME